MNFAGALVALYRGHKVKRKHWTGYWQGIDLEDKGVDKKIIVMHTYQSRDILLTDTDDIFYTLSNTLADDWEIIEDWDKKTAQPDHYDDSKEHSITDNKQYIKNNNQEDPRELSKKYPGSYYDPLWNDTNLTGYRSPRSTEDTKVGDFSTSSQITCQSNSSESYNTGYQD